VAGKPIRRSGLRNLTLPCEQGVPKLFEFKHGIDKT